MPWVAVAILTLRKDWVFSSPVSGSLFRVKHSASPGRRGHICQSSGGMLPELADIRRIYGREESELFRFAEPESWQTRSIGFRAEKYAEVFSVPWRIQLEVWEP